MNEIQRDMHDLGQLTVKANSLGKRPVTKRRSNVTCAHYVGMQLERTRCRPRITLTCSSSMRGLHLIVHMDATDGSASVSYDKHGSDPIASWPRRPLAVANAFAKKYSL